MPVTAKAADADLVGILRSDDQDGDDRDHRLRQSGANGRQHAAHGARGESEAVSKPLDGVGEELSRNQNDQQGYDDEKDG